MLSPHRFDAGLLRNHGLIGFVVGRRRRFPEEEHILEFVARGTGWSWAVEHERLILDQARFFGDLGEAPDLWRHQARCVFGHLSHDARSRTGAKAWLRKHRRGCRFDEGHVILDWDEVQLGLAPAAPRLREGPPIDGYAAWNLTKWASGFFPTLDGAWRWREHTWVLHEVAPDTRHILSIRNTRTGEVRRLVPPDATKP